MTEKLFIEPATPDALEQFIRDSFDRLAAETEQAAIDDGWEDGWEDDDEEAEYDDDELEEDES